MRMPGAMSATLVGPLVLAALVVATARVQEYRVRPYLYANLYLPSGKLVEQTSMGYRELAADLIWFQAVQYFGGYAKSQHSLAYFNGLIDIVTDLDPHFQFPYVFGAVVMSQDMGNFERGVEILKKGMRANPEVWEFPFEIGFLYYITRADAISAAHYFDLSSRMPGGGDRARRFAAFVYSKAGHEETSIRMWEELANTSEQPYMRELARRYIEQIRHNGRIGKDGSDS
jgi:tetratricopeptide (TPR) repeat protein